MGKFTLTAAGPLGSSVFVPFSFLNSSPEEQ